MLYTLAPCLIELRSISFREILQATTFSTWLLIMPFHSVYMKSVAITPFHSFMGSAEEYLVHSISNKTPNAKSNGLQCMRDQLPDTTRAARASECQEIAIDGDGAEKRPSFLSSDHF